jgi:hypothetical protein
MERLDRGRRAVSDFKGRHFAGEIVLWAVRWYCRYGVSYRDPRHRTVSCTGASPRGLDGAVGAAIRRAALAATERVPPASPQRRKHLNHAVLRILMSRGSRATDWVRRFDSPCG